MSAEPGGRLGLDALVVVLLALGAGGYAGALRAARGRGRWPAHRPVLWSLGLAAAGAAVLGPVAEAAHESFPAHMLGHLLLGMVAPLCLVLAAPVTLALRALPVARARAVSRVLRSPPVRVLTSPVVAAALSAGGLWALYSTRLYSLTHTSVTVHALVHAHVLIAGYLFTASVVGVDPDPHRASFAVRGTVLVGFLAAHSVLAKRLYGHPPPGVEDAEARTGSLLMYYGGDAVDLALLVVFFAQWYARARPRTPSATTRAGVGPGSGGRVLRPARRDGPGTGRRTRRALRTRLLRAPRSRRRAPRCGPG